jgi:hypothetical protein
VSEVWSTSSTDLDVTTGLVYCECHGEVDTDTLVLLKDWKLNPISVADVMVTVTTKLYQPEPAYVSA